MRSGWKIGEPVWDRLSRNLDVGDCWEFTGYIDPRGYGVLRVNGVRWLTHRLVWSLLVGEFPKDTLDHLCRNRRCANPDHLQPASHAENVLRGEGITARQARQTHCLRGHPLRGDNLYLYRGMRHCRECRKLRQRVVR